MDNTVRPGPCISPPGCPLSRAVRINRHPEGGRGVRVQGIAGRGMKPTVYIPPYPLYTPYYRVVSPVGGGRACRGCMFQLYKYRLPAGYQYPAPPSTSP